MDRCEQIKAFHQSAEFYQGLELAYDGSSGLKDEIMDIIDDVTLEMGMIPKLNENTAESIYIEFKDAYARNGGNYFNNVLEKLGITYCEARL
jgi:hypothetical protein